VEHSASLTATAGAAPDSKQAVAWQCRAAADDLAEVQSALGDMFAAGRGVARNDSEATKVSAGRKSRSLRRADAPC